MSADKDGRKQSPAPGQAGEGAPGRESTTAASGSAPSGRATEREARAERLAAQLRANLARRKAQARGRTADGVPGKPSGGGSDVD
ncbi:hypothetical protein [Phreatobacter sp.]|uniref:hypothetical protein n=1 Tax=Phreatobacter sp. TaxID=1966341 RepID=UPI003F6FBFFE